jgi:hypothetical protein
MLRRLVVLCTALSSLDAFRIAPSSSPLTHHQGAVCSSIKCSIISSLPRRSWTLRSTAEGDDDSTAAEEGADETTKTSSEAAPTTSDATDILNSPAFLKRKVEVLQSDVAALEKELEEATALAASGKAEWGTKFDMLNKEVSTLYFFDYNCILVNHIYINLYISNLSCRLHTTLLI